MLADGGGQQAHSGMLDAGIHRPGEWISSLVGFIGSVLPSWRDDPSRPAQTNETALTAQLCAHLTSASRHAPGWDSVQFKREEPDEQIGNRSIDIAVAPNGTVIWIEGREYTEYQTILPIECKRLPTPSGAKRDEREYLHSRLSTTGGLQRFKVGYHASCHSRAAMIGYLQNGDVLSWATQLEEWTDELQSDAIEGWSVADKLRLVEHDTASRTALLTSNHARGGHLSCIAVDHLWIEI